MSEYPEAPPPESQPPAPKRKGGAGLWALLVIGLVLLLCGCGSAMGAMTQATSGQPSPTAGDPVATATVVVLRFAFLIGGLVCVVVALVKLLRRR